MMGGGPGKHRGVHLCRTVNKPILPITAFGGAAEEIFAPELKNFDKNYGRRITRESYPLLDEQFPDSIDELVANIVGLCSRPSTSNAVFGVMAYRKELADSWHTIKRVVQDYNFDCERMDMVPDTDRTFP